MKLRAEDRAALAGELTTGRERRSFKVDGAEVRMGEDGSLTFDGYATVYSRAYDMGWYEEEFAPNACALALREADDVRFLLNHDGLPMARTRSGTLQLSEDATGLRAIASLDARMTMVADLKITMDRGDLDQMSLAFRATQQTWNEDYTKRTITECRLYDVSAVTFPANDAATATLRSSQMLSRLTASDPAILAEELRADGADPAELAALMRRTADLIVPQVRGLSLSAAAARLSLNERMSA